MIQMYHLWNSQEQIHICVYKFSHGLFTMSAMYKPCMKRLHVFNMIEFIKHPDYLMFPSHLLVYAAVCNHTLH